MNCQLFAKSLQATWLWKGIWSNYFCFHYSSFPFPPKQSLFSSKACADQKQHQPWGIFLYQSLGHSFPNLGCLFSTLQNSISLPCSILHGQQGQAASGERYSQLGQTKSEQPHCLSPGQQMQPDMNFFDGNRWYKISWFILNSHQRAKQVSIKQTCSPQGRLPGSCLYLTRLWCGSVCRDRARQSQPDC